MEANNTALAATVEYRDGDEMYPDVPSPTKLLVSCDVETYPVIPKLAIVLRSCVDEIYPAEPRPATLLV